MRIEFTPRGICARKITVELTDDGAVESVDFVGGCQGNHSGIGKLVKGMKAEEVIKRLSGTTCGARNTSCPDQLAVALKSALTTEK